MTAYQRAHSRWNAIGMTNHILDRFASYQRGKGLADTTIRNRESILRTLESFIGSPVLELTLDNLRDYLGRPTPVTKGTRRTERTAMMAFYAYAVDEGLRDDDPSARLAPVQAPKGTPRPFTPEQIDAMLHSGAYTRTRAMILLGCYQGFRVSQIARVSGHDIDRVSMTITTLAKGDKPGTLPLHPVIAELSTQMPDGFWFPARYGREGHIRPASVTNLITKAKHRAGIRDPKLTPHSLRHSFGTDLVESGVDIRVVQELMMHESLTTTQVYTGVSERRKHEGIRVLPSREIPQQSGRIAA